MPLIIFYNFYSVAIPGDPKPLLLKYHVVIVAFMPNLQRLLFHSVTEFLHHSSATELILPLALYKGVFILLEIIQPISQLMRFINI